MRCCCAGARCGVSALCICMQLDLCTRCCERRMLLNWPHELQALVINQDVVNQVSELSTKRSALACVGRLSYI